MQLVPYVSALTYASSSFYSSPVFDFPWMRSSFFLQISIDPCWIHGIHNSTLSTFVNRMLVHMVHMSLCYLRAPVVLLSLCGVTALDSVRTAFWEGEDRRSAREVKGFYHSHGMSFAFWMLDRRHQEHRAKTLGWGCSDCAWHCDTSQPEEHVWLLTYWSGKPVVSEWQAHSNCGS